MRLVKLTSFYPAYLREFYAKRPGLAKKGYAEQRDALMYDAFGWADFWSVALRGLGYEALEIVLNASPMQAAWAAENGVPGGASADLRAVAVAQMKAFRPDVIWFEDSSDGIVETVRDEVPSAKLVIGWAAGSGVSAVKTWGRMDLILSCMPELTEYFRGQGLRAEQVHHAFDPRIGARLAEGAKKTNFSFIGQIVTEGAFHGSRARLLETLADKTDITIFTPGGGAGPVERAKDVLRAVRRGGMPKSPYGRALRKRMRPAAYGLEMFQTLRDSKVSLNIHADSSTRYASNMRLFEITGAGACLLTDWKENMHGLFAPEREAVTYRSPEECVEKALWLAQHPDEAAKIAAAGRARTLREHTYAERAKRLDGIIKEALA